MRIASFIAQYLLGLLFTFSGLNGFFNFTPMPPKPPLATEFLHALMASHYVVAVFVLQFSSGVLFLANRYIPLALTLTGPVIVNILLFHLSMDPAGIVPGAIAAVCWLLVFYRVRHVFAGIFRHHVHEPAR